jgi:hypothetical protein
LRQAPLWNGSALPEEAVAEIERLRSENQARNLDALNSSLMAQLLAATG